MSRSRKKYPVVATACSAHGAQGKWKKQCRVKIRRIPVDKDIPERGLLKRMSGDIWDSPYDGRMWWKDNPKAYRK